MSKVYKSLLRKKISSFDSILSGYQCRFRYEFNSQHCLAVHDRNMAE